ncbi:MAG: hypothetical protein COT90_00460 [Candidatus Diapherotrites archaeon CG10_big_fil_rev_8_21_14_0_10_31_34]|nr:MAG: hypothetical protein COT90_00460 [Candidatus Diapherotrites archaeon CG10_big_fil_rev_8_21_14_0_10_31_34]
MGEFEVKLSGFQDISGIDKNVIKTNCEKFFLKNNKKLKNIEYIEIKLKDYQIKGTRRKFSVHSVLGFSGTMLTSKSFDWNLLKAVDLSLKKIESEIDKKFIGKIQEKNRGKARSINRLLE